MAEVVLKTIFQLKRGLSSAWTNVNPILADGEPGFELDTGKLKIGRNNTAWNDLEYFGGDFEINADNKSITIGEDGEVSIYGFADADPGMILRIGEDGNIEWYTPAISDEELGELKSQIEDFESALEAKADKDDTYTKEEVDAAISQATLPAVFQGTVPSYDDLSEKEDTAEPGDIWQTEDTGEWWIYDGENWSKYENSLDLTDYVKKETFEPVASTVESLPDSILSGTPDVATTDDKTTIAFDVYNKDPESGEYSKAENGAKVELDIGTKNIIKIVKAAGTTLPNTNGEINIPIATAQSAGLVKASDEIAVDDDGTLTVTSLDVSKLTQSEDNTLILDGGSLDIE